VQSTTLADMSAYHSYEVAEDVANAKWHFYIDGTEVCGTGLSANLPASNVAIKAFAGHQNLIATQRNMDMAWLFLSADK
jgi:hypothetical protein